MSENPTQELLRSFIDINGSYENVRLAISVNNMPRKNARDFIARVYHTHPYYEFFYIRDEGLTISAKDMADIPLHTGDVCIVPPFCEHFTTYFAMLWEKSNTFFLGTGFTFHDNHLNTSRDLYKLLRTRFENDGAPLIIRANECNTAEIYAALTSFRKNAEAGHSRAAFLDYCRALECLITGESPEKPELSKKDIIVKIDNLISCYYMYDIKLTDIADCFYVSAHTLNRLIYEYYSDTFHNLLIRRRMQVAASYLLNTEDSVASIAEKAGYSSLNNFYTAFKRHHGILPADYRRETKKKDE